MFPMRVSASLIIPLSFNRDKNIIYYDFSCINYGASVKFVNFRNCIVIFQLTISYALKKKTDFVLT